MFDATSRYANCEIATHTVTEPDGTVREVRHVRRRIIPPAEGMTVVVEHTVAPGERLDTITARYLGDPAQFWRVCDANGVMGPEELAETGTTIRIAMPGA
jgi:hypothetical protein